MSAPILLTSAPARSLEWFRARAGLITASSAASIIAPGSAGVYGTPLTEFQRITAELQGKAIAELPDDESETERDPDDESDDVATERAELAWGNDSEPLHRELLSKAIAPITLDGRAPGVFRHQTLTWLAASPDDGCTCPDLGRGVAELKAPTRFGSHKWHAGPPIGYVIQHAVQMSVMDVPWGILSVLIAPRPRWQRMFADPVMWQRIEEGLTLFWDDCILQDRPPLATSSDKDLAALRALYPTSSTRTYFATPEDMPYIDMLEEGRALASQAEKLDKEAKSHLWSRIGDAGLVVLPGNAGSYTFKSSERHNKPKAASVSVVRRLVRVK